MKKLLSNSERLLLSLGLMGDVALGVYADSFSLKSKSFLNFVGGKKGSLRNSLYYLLRTKNIEKVVKNGEPCFRLTSAGVEKIQRIFPISKLAKKGWDGRWRIVIFDIPEKERRIRDNLRNKLTGLGFGQLQESVYISPLDILADLGEMLKQLNFHYQVIAFEAKQVLDPDPKKVAKYVWNLEELNKNYEEIIEEVENLPTDPKERTKKVEEIKKRYFEILLKDPILPLPLLPEDWLGAKAKKIISNLA